MTKIRRPAPSCGYRAAVDNSRTCVRRSSDTPEQAYEKASAQAGGHPIGVCGDHGSPDSSRLNTLSNRLIDRPVTQIRERMIGRDASRIGRPECLFEPPPDIC